MMLNPQELARPCFPRSRERTARGCREPEDEKAPGRVRGWPHLGQWLVGKIHLAHPDKGLKKRIHRA